MSKSAIKILADTFDDGEKPALPYWAGLFRVYEIEAKPGGVVIAEKLWIALHVCYTAAAW
jgi:hypothetical protein